MYNIQAGDKVLYNSQVIYECWYFTHMWKVLAWQHHVNKREGFEPHNLLNPPTLYWSARTEPGKWVVMYLYIRGIDFDFFYDFDIWFWNCSDSVLFCCCSFYYVWKWRSTMIPPLSTKRTITSHLHSLKTRKTTMTEVGNPCAGLRQTQKSGEVKLIKVIPALPSCNLSSTYKMYDFNRF